MRINLFQRHSSDEQLLAYVDGELSARDTKSVQSHLKTCWECRARLQELEQQAQATARAYADPNFLPPTRIAEAKVRFGAWRRDFEARFSSAPEIKVLKSSYPRFGIAAAACLVCVIAGALWYELNRRTSTAGELIAAARAMETQVFAGPHSVLQDFRVEIAEIRPQKRQHQSRLSVCTDAKGGRFVARWRNLDGTLKYAVWGPSRNEEYVYDRAVAAHAVRHAYPSGTAFPLVNVADHGIDRESLEAAFMRWIEGHRWRPISLISNLATFASSDGVLMHVERSRSTNGEPIVRLRARRQTTTLLAELVLELEAASYRPRLQKLRLESDDRVIELWLIREREAAVPTANLEPAVFRPEIPVSSPLAPPKPAPYSADSSKLASSEIHPPDRTSRPSPAELDSIEVEIRFALHRTGACLGEPVEVLRESEGIRVRGIVDTAKRKDQLLAALAEIGAVELVTVDIGAVEETGEDALPSTHPVALPAQSLRIAATALPIQRELEQYFRAHAKQEGGSVSVREQVSGLANEAIALSASARDEIWAIRRLADQYPPERIKALPPHPRRLLEAMFRSHISALRERTEAMRAKLVPALSPIAASPPSASVSKKVMSSTWDASSVTVLEAVRAMHELISALFAGSSFPVEVETSTSGSKRLRVKTAEESVTDVLETLAALAGGLPHLEDQIANEFSARRSLAADKTPPR